MSDRNRLRYTFVVRKKRTTHWYFRHRQIGVRALPGLPGEARFHVEYGRLLAKAEQLGREAAEREDTRSIRSLAESYLASDEWSMLSKASQRDYRREINRLCAMAGDLPFSQISRRGALAMRSTVLKAVAKSQLEKVDARATRDAEAAASGRVPSSRRKAPIATDGARTADYFVSVLSALMGWAVLHEYIDANPLEGINKLKNKRNVEHHVPWTEEQIVRVLAEAPRSVADGVTVGIYTGQRLEDCMLLGRKHYVAPNLRVKQLKTNIRVDVRAIGPLKDLVERRLAAGDKVDALVVRDDGQPYSERLFSDHLRVFLDSIGYHDLSFHGLKYAAAGTLNEAGCSVATIVSLIGNATFQLAMQYLSQREHQQRAAAAMTLASEARNRS